MFTTCVGSTKDALSMESDDTVGISKIYNKSVSEMHTNERPHTWCNSVVASLTITYHRPIHIASIDKYITSTECKIQEDNTILYHSVLGKVTLCFSVGKLKTSLLCSIHVCIPYNIVNGQIYTSCTSRDKIQVDRPHLL